MDSAASAAGWWASGCPCWQLVRGKSTGAAPDLRGNIPDPSPADACEQASTTLCWSASLFGGSNSVTEHGVATSHVERQVRGVRTCPPICLDSGRIPYRSLLSARAHVHPCANCYRDAECRMPLCTGRALAHLILHGQGRCRLLSSAPLRVLHAVGRTFGQLRPWWGALVLSEVHPSLC